MNMIHIIHNYLKEALPLECQLVECQLEYNPYTFKPFSENFVTITNASRRLYAAIVNDNIRLYDIRELNIIIDLNHPESLQQLTTAILKYYEPA